MRGGEGSHLPAEPSYDATTPIRFARRRYDLKDLAARLLPIAPNPCSRHLNGTIALRVAAPESQHSLPGCGWPRPDAHLPDQPTHVDERPRAGPVRYARQRQRLRLPMPQSAEVPCLPTLPLPAGAD